MYILCVFLYRKVFGLVLSKHLVLTIVLALILYHMSRWKCKSYRKGDKSTYMPYGGRFMHCDVFIDIICFEVYELNFIAILLAM